MHSGAESELLDKLACALCECADLSICLTHKFVHICITLHTNASGTG